jgi:Tfp pilus assembly protein PilF
VTDFRNALSYSRDDVQYRLKLAKALADSGQTEEAAAYFNNLWENDPSNAAVNLELARLAVRRQDLSQALRFFHAAIYGIWPDEPERRRDAARLELVGFLLRRGATLQADAELTALAADPPETSSARVQIADLFMQAEDHARALAEYRSALRLDPANHAATAGVGQAAFQLREYGVARLYLRRAVAHDPANASLANLADVADAAIELDPYQPQLSDHERRSRVIRAFRQAGARLRQCAAASRYSGRPSAASAGNAPGDTRPGTSSRPPILSQRSATELQAEYAQWQQLREQVNEDTLRHDPKLMETVTDLVFQIERQSTDKSCGPSAPGDTALAWIAHRHEAY